MSNGCQIDEVVILEEASGQWLRFRNPRRVYSVSSLEQVIPALQQVETMVREQGLYGAGFLSYEAAPAFDTALCAKPLEAFPLLWFGLYAEPERLTTLDFSPIHHNEPALPWARSVAAGEYHGSFDRIKRYIQAGHTYQVNFSLRLRSPFAGDPWSYFGTLVQAGNAKYGAFINANSFAICSASPELFFRLEGGLITSRPMKGTAPRGRFQSEDLEQARWLRESQKNRSENLMIVDMVRNDLGRIAMPGSVQVAELFTLEKFPTVWQMTSTVQARTNADLCEILRAMFPCASITGAPKRRTMEIIAELENAPRRIYTGTIGFLAPNRRAQFNVAIRTVLIEKTARQAEYGVGGGIVWESTPADELAECETKARLLQLPPSEWQLLETLLWTPQNGYFLLDYHLDRLRQSAEYFSIRVDLEAVRQSLEFRAADFPAVKHKVRLLIPRQGPFAIQSALLVLSEPRSCQRVCLAPTPIDSSDPFLFHKTTHRQVYDQALAACPGYNDVLLWNREGEVTESCIANVVVELNGELLTPPVPCGLLAGTYRAWLLESPFSPASIPGGHEPAPVHPMFPLSSSGGEGQGEEALSLGSKPMFLARGAVKEKPILVKDLRQCARIFLINSVRQQWEVKLDGAVGAIGQPVRYPPMARDATTSPPPQSTLLSTGTVISLRPIG